MNCLKFFIPLIIVPLFAFSSLHKFYVGVTQINYIKKDKSLQITSRIFIDDIETILRKHHGNTITLAGKQESKTNDKLIANYLKEHMLIKINGKKVNLSYIGKAYEGDIIQCYLEVEDVKTIKSFEISNKALFDGISEQQNIIKTNINNKQKSVIHTIADCKTILNFD